MDESKAIKTLSTLVSVFEKCDVKYWADYGTLLGAVREHKFISWDTDIELYFKYYYPTTFREVTNELLKRGFQVRLKPGNMIDVRGEGYVGCSIGFFEIKLRDYLYSFVFSNLPRSFRMFVIRFLQKYYFSSRSEIVRPDDGNVRDKTWHCWKIRSFLPSFFAGRLTKTRFYDSFISIPYFAEELLYLRYGKDWKIPKRTYESYTT